ncbi:hypothetical protein JTE90_017200 [Oedothorax gibbosus]|uniref:Uncharacterized protein n=1 Tax=Oedothorax gibbosus TaxID=931172 RepID=A0AAV6V951_9ARAC|nr:hypothetical protein JTE90_017200 [Oedothorax gibbosus]
MGFVEGASLVSGTASGDYHGQMNKWGRRKTSPQHSSKQQHHLHGQTLRITQRFVKPLALMAQSKTVLETRLWPLQHISATRRERCRVTSTNWTIHQPECEGWECGRFVKPLALMAQSKTVLETRLWPLQHISATRRERCRVTSTNWTIHQPECEGWECGRSVYLRST